MQNKANYEAKGYSYRNAFTILEEGCEVPPSLEVFDFELALSRRDNPGLSEEGFARRLVQRYQRVEFRRESP